MTQRTQFVRVAAGIPRRLRIEERQTLNAYSAKGALVGYVTTTDNKRFGAERLDGVKLRGMYDSFDKARDALRTLYPDD